MRIHTRAERTFWIPEAMKLTVESILQVILSTFSVLIDGGSSAAVASSHFSLRGVRPAVRIIMHAVHSDHLSRHILFDKFLVWLYRAASRSARDGPKSIDNRGETFVRICAVKSTRIHRVPRKLNTLLGIPATQ
jgi:hypothetical protein